MRQRSSQWAAQFLVAAELERDGYDVCFTMGHHTPIADLMVGDPTTGEQFWIDVKGVWGKSAWWGKPKSPRKDLFYICVSVGKNRMEDRFFIMTQLEFNALVDEYHSTHLDQEPNGFKASAPFQFGNAWSKHLPGTTLNAA